MKLHFHRYSIERTVFTKPLDPIDYQVFWSSSNILNNQWSRDAREFGFTSIIERCTICPKTRVHQHLGNLELPK